MSPLSPTLVLAGFAILLLVGKVLEFLSGRYRVPDSLVLIALGIAGGQFFGSAQDALGGAARVFTSAALVFILFESAVGIRLGELWRSARSTVLLTVLSFVFTVGIVAVLGSALLGLPWITALVLGAILGGTSTSVIVPLVRSLKIGREAEVVLTLESALNDVFTVVTALALMAVPTRDGASAGTLMGRTALEIGLALLVGIAAGGLVGGVLRQTRAQRGSLAILVASVLATWAGAEAAVGQGAIACLAMGLVLGNLDALLPRRLRDRASNLDDAERLFLENAAFVFKVLFFVYLGSSLRLEGLAVSAFGAVLALGVVAIARPLAVRISLRAPPRDVLLSSFIAPKGLSAAVLAAVPVQRGLAGGETVELAATGCIVFSIVLSALLPQLFDGSRWGTALRKLMRLPAPEAVPAGAPPPEPGPTEPARMRRSPVARAQPGTKNARAASTASREPARLTMSPGWSTSCAVGSTTLWPSR